MADNHQLADGNNDDDDIFVYTGEGQQVPRDVKRVRIAENVDTIPEGVFSERHQLIEVVGHDKLKKVERSAFYYCRSLRRLTKMGGVIEIEGSAFSNCTALALGELEFDKLKIIGGSAFTFCDSLRSISMPSVRRVGPCAFWGCTALMDAVFGKDLEGIEEFAFYGCPSLRSIAIPLKNNLFVEGDGNVFDSSSLRVDVVGGMDKTISSLYLESWRDEMKEEIHRINQTLPEIPLDQKTVAIQQWIRSAINRMEHYKTEHKVLVKEAVTLLELALWKANLEENGVDLEGVRVTRRQVKRARKERCITSGAGIIIKNVLPFLELK